MCKNTTRYVVGHVEDNVLVAAIEVREIGDDEAAFAVRDGILALLESSGADHVVIDMKNIEFFGSIGLLAFLGVRRQLLDKNGRIVICGMMPPIQSMFVASRLISEDPAVATAFEMADSVEQALTSFTSV